MANKEIEKVGTGRIIILCVLILFTLIISMSLVAGLVSGLSWDTDVTNATIVTDDNDIKEDAEEPTDENVDASADDTTTEETPDEPVVEDPVVEDPIEPVSAIVDAPVDDTTTEETPDEPVVEDPVVEDPVVEDPVVEDPVVEDPVVEEEVTEEPTDDNWVINYVESITIMYADTPLSTLSYVQLMTILTSVFGAGMLGMTGNVVYRKKKVNRNKKMKKQAQATANIGGTRRVATKSEVEKFNNKKQTKLKPVKKKKKGVENVTIEEQHTGTTRRKKK